MLLPKSLSASDIKRLFGIEIVEGPCDISQFGGVLPFIEYLEKMRLRQQLEKLFGNFKARSMMQLVVSLVVGCKDLEEAERLGKDPLLKRVIGRSVVATQLARNFKSFTPTEVQMLHEFVMSLSVLELVGHTKRYEDLEIDVDQTAIEMFGHQEGVTHGYLEQDKIELCYQYLFFRLANLNTFLYGTIRDGSCHSQHDFCGYLHQLLPMFKDSGRTVRLRADSGYFNEEAFSICTKNKIFFYVKAPMSPSRRAQAESPSLVWVKDQKNPDIEYADYVTVTKDDAIWREIFKRVVKVKVEGGLFEENLYRYDCLASNDMSRDLHEFFPYYNQRANIENNFRELKNDYNLGSIVCHEFHANDVITQTTILTYILVQHFKRLFLDPEDQRMQLSTLRSRIFSMIGRKRRGQRREWVKVYSVFLTLKQIVRIYCRILSVKSLLVSAPQFLDGS